MTVRGNVRRALARAGGSVARGLAREAARQPVGRPFAEARVVEGRDVRAIPVGDPVTGPEGMGFVDGIQQFAVEGHFGVTPIVRARVAAAVLERREGTLRGAARSVEEFLTVPCGRLTPAQREALDGVELPIRESDAGPRPHPLLDRWAAVQVIEQRRDRCERDAAARFLAARPDAWLVVDGGVTGLAAVPGAERAIGVVKSHETQFLEATDLEAALTLPAGTRSSAFVRRGAGGVEATSWYLRLWPWSEEDLLHGLARVERLMARGALDSADEVSRWVLAERSPIADRDPRWDRLLYPMHHVEMYLRAEAGGWH